MSLYIYDSAARRLREFTPLRAGTASIYVCGATAQAPPHLGHARSAVVFDILHRWLACQGYEVTFIRNVTDLDDTILRKAASAGQPWWAWSARHERLFRGAYAALGCLPPTHEPRATGHITEMVELTQRLIDGGHAHPVSGDVYFSMRSLAAHGALCRQDPATQLNGNGEGKPDRRDCALWKTRTGGQPAWPTPWGRARPGRHLGCSAMSTTYLGRAFDIHGGGRELIFPHHEYELAQSRAAGDPFAQYWMHSAGLRVGGEKMSESLDNSVLVGEILERWRPVDVRYYLGAAHYRSALEFSPEALDRAAAAYRRIEQFFERARTVLDNNAGRRLPRAFTTAMDNDLDLPAALYAVHSTVHRGNAALDASHKRVARAALSDTLAMTGVLGLSPAQWATTRIDTAGARRGPA
jgi:cysteinyl-tRNA synthetase